MVSGRKQKLKARAAALNVVVSGSGSTPTRSGSGVISKESRRQRKLGKQRERETKKRELVERELSLRVDKDKKSTPGSVLALDGLGDALAEASALARAVASKTSNSSGTTSRKGGVSAKARKHRVREETEQVANVLAHPAFMTDPAEALRQHLLNTVCAEPSAVPAAPAEKLSSLENKSKVTKETKKCGAMQAEKKARSRIQLDASDDAIEKARNEARERLREKRKRKEEFGRVAEEKRKSMQGIRKVRVSPARGRIGVKRPKILEPE